MSKKLFAEALGTFILVFLETMALYGTPALIAIPARYNVATTEFIASGGDGLTAWTRGRVLLGMDGEGVSVAQATQRLLESTGALPTAAPRRVVPLVVAGEAE